MDDLISRQTAIDAVNIADDNGQILTILDVLDVIKHLPSAQPEADCQKCVFCGFSGFKQFQTAQPEIKGIITENGRIKMLTAQHWIPCSERLPDRAGLYWITAVYGSDTRIMTSRFFDGTKWERIRRDYTKIIAWMPLPEAYKEGE